MKILLLGSLNAQILSLQLNHFDVNATFSNSPKFLKPSNIRNFDVVYGVYLMSISRHTALIKLLRKKVVTHVIGTDASVSKIYKLPPSKYFPLSLNFLKALVERLN